MENKTAIQELLEIVEMDYNNGVEISTKAFYGMLKGALEKEKQQIIEANRAGVDMIINNEDFITGKEYYNETYE